MTFEGPAAQQRSALFTFEEGPNGAGISVEKHYRLVPPDDVTTDDLRTYRGRTEGE